MSKVYIVNTQKHEYEKAAKYGPMVVVTEGNMPIFKTDLMIDILRDRLSEFTSEDFLLVSGPTLLNIMASNVAFTKTAVLKLLIFDAKEQDYTVRHLTQN